MNTPSSTEKTIPYEEYRLLVEEFAEKEKAIQERNWIDNQISNFDEVLRLNYTKSLEEFCKVILQEMAEMTQAFSGVFYLHDTERQLIYGAAGYSCKIENLQQKEFQTGDNVVGQAFLSQKMLLFDDLPLKNVSLKSAGIQINNANVLLMPMVFNQVGYGVLELIYIKNIENKFVEIIQKTSRNIAAMLESIFSSNITKKLLKESQEQAEMLKAQEEEMRQNMEELISAQEELAKRTQLSEKQKASIENNFNDLEKRQKELEKYQEKIANNEQVLKKSLEKSQNIEKLLNQKQEESEISEEKLRNNIQELFEEQEKMQETIKVLEKEKKEAQMKGQELTNQLQEKEEELKNIKKLMRQSKLNE